MLVFITIIHVLLCVFMIFVILLQPGKDAGMGSALGGGAATSAFGGRGAVTFLSKLTAACASLFFLTSLGLSFVGLRGSVTESDSEEPAPIAAPGKIDGGAASVPAPGGASSPGSTTPGGASGGMSSGGLGPSGLSPLPLAPAPLDSKLRLAPPSGRLTPKSTATPPPSSP